MSQRLPLLFCAVVLTAVNAFGLDQDVDHVAQPVTNPGYTAEQAKAGKKVYKQHCLSCHPKGYFTQVFRAWQGEPLRDLFGVMRADMPQSNPGGLSPEVYTENLAYILAETDYPAGVTPLDPMSPGFRDIRIAPASMH